MSSSLFFIFVESGFQVTLAGLELSMYVAKAVLELILLPPPPVKGQAAAITLDFQLLFHALVFTLLA